MSSYTTVFTTYEHMKFEFNVAYLSIKSGGLLLADDALWNAAFVEFAKEKKTLAAQIIRGVSVLKWEVGR
jgi:hypothetical protein